MMRHRQCFVAGLLPLPSLVLLPVNPSLAALPELVPRLPGSVSRRRGRGTLRLPGVPKLEAGNGSCVGSAACSMLISPPGPHLHLSRRCFFPCRSWVLPCLSHRDLSPWHLRARHENLLQLSSLPFLQKQGLAYHWGIPFFMWLMDVCCGPENE